MTLVITFKLTYREYENAKTSSVIELIRVKSALTTTGI